jgi:hypothetical protein
MKFEKDIAQRHKGTEDTKKSQGRGEMKNRAGICYLFLLFAIAVCAQEAWSQETGVFVSVETYPDIPVAGVPWNLTLFVDHNIPDEVTVIAPPFSTTLRLDRFTKNPRIRGGKLQTVIAYTLIPDRAGSVRIEPFTIRTPAGETKTTALLLNVRSAGTATVPITARLEWEGVPGQMTTGERAVFDLRSAIPPPAPSVLPHEFFMPEVPQGVILSSLPLTAEERASGIAIRLSLIPLDRDLILPAATLRYENIIFEIPALTIRVTALFEKASRGGTAAQREEEEGEEKKREDVLFPGFDFGLLDKSMVKKVWYGQCEDIYNSALSLWEMGLYAQALAELRGNERDHPAGVYFRDIRREAEHSLGIFNTADESRWKRKIILALAFLLFLVVIVTPFVYFTLMRKPLWKKGVFFLLTAAFSVAGFISLYLFMDLGSVFGGKAERYGITYNTPVRRTADFEGQEFFSFKEGQPVVIMLNSGSWLHVRTNNVIGGMDSGWVQADKVIFY